MTLDAEAGRHGIPIARFSYSQCDNDRQLMKAAAATASESNLRTFAVANLWVTDGSTLPTQGAANRAPTITVLVARAAGAMAGARS